MLKTVKLSVFIWFIASFYSNTALAQKTSIIPSYVLSFLGTGQKNLTIGKQYYTSFETVNEFKGLYIVPQNYMASSTHDLSKEQLVTGNLSHKAWIYKKNSVIANKNTNHRAYPTFQFDKTSLGVIKSAVLIEFWVWADITLNHNSNSSWFSLATFSSYSDQYWYHSYLINVDSNYRVHLMHVPHNAMSVHDIYQTQAISLPKKQWVKMTAYIDYLSDNKFASPFIAVWQDGNLVSAARFDNRIDLNAALKLPSRPPCLDDLPKNATIEQAEQICNLTFTNGLAQAHFGLYAPPELGSGVIFNDDLTVSEILR